MITATAQKQNVQNSKQIIALAKDYLLDFIDEENILSGSIELEGFEQRSDETIVSFSYYKKDPLRFSNKFSETLESINRTYLDYIKDYKTIVVDQSGDLKKISSEIE
jgi:hypothetical protein